MVVLAGLARPVVSSVLAAGVLICHAAWLRGCIPSRPHFRVGGVTLVCRVLSVAGLPSLPPGIALPGFSRLSGSFARGKSPEPTQARRMTEASISPLRAGSSVVLSTGYSRIAGRGRVDMIRFVTLRSLGGEVY
ncbi:hypothetical protein BDP81DRAFT_452373 [Colletotrichum phormii]|uniref:Uncharacterized protein n=1 Tax=Colletotrichum phormii TaxID=359342 RepID=A0AAI9ZJR8_9PEZI|nr:uncharacterized protein BDP81DRAFT_452373 [Colletotrichum phormii]KAK1633268.1 hypothetical protein BDP81DRAFT_452373 [Colletotrichum phormii]